MVSVYTKCYCQKEMPLTLSQIEVCDDVYFILWKQPVNSYCTHTYKLIITQTQVQAAIPISTTKSHTQVKIVNTILKTFQGLRLLKYFSGCIFDSWEL